MIFQRDRLTPKETHRRWRRWLLPLGISLLLVLLARLVWGQFTARDLAKAERAVRGAGEPLTLAEFPAPPAPAGPDAWPMYEQLLAEARRAGIGQAVALTETQARRSLTESEQSQLDADTADLQLLHRWSEEIDARAEFAELTRARLQRYQPLLEQLTRIAAVDAVAWPRRLNPMDELSVDLVPLSRLVRMLTARAVLRADAGDAAAAVLDLTTVLRVADHLARAPQLELRLVEADITEGAARALSRIVAAECPADPLLAALASAAGGGTDPDLLRRAVIHARARSQTIHEQLIAGELTLSTLQGEPTEPGAGTKVLHWLLKPFMQAAQADALAGFSAVLPLTGRPYHQVAEPLEQRMQQMADDPPSQNEAQTFGAVANVIRWSALSRTHRRLMRSALAAWRFRRDHGAWPDTLDALAGAYLDEIPLDPMTGRALQYRPDADPPRLYSVGIDRSDNGGVADPVDDLAGAAGHDVVLDLLDQPTTQPTSQPATRPTTQPASAPAGR